MVTGDLAQSTSLSLICHTRWQCWWQHVLTPVSLSKDSSNSERATAESVWFHVSPTKPPGKFSWMEVEWKGRERQLHFQIPAGGCRAASQRHHLLTHKWRKIQHGRHWHDYGKGQWHFYYRLFRIQPPMNSTPLCTLAPIMSVWESSNIETTSLISHLPLVCPPFIPNAKVLVNRILHVAFVAQTFPLGSG